MMFLKRLKKLQDRIALLLPHKENFSKDSAGSVTLFVKDLNQKSKYINTLDIYGNTDQTPLFGFNYYNLESTLMHRFGRNKFHTKEFIKKMKSSSSVKLIEIHNRPVSVLAIKKALPEVKLIHYYHNDPLLMKGFMSPRSRKKILDACDVIYFVSEYLKKQFCTNLEINRIDKKKLLILYNGILPNNKIKKTRKKNIIFVGRLEKNKGFFEFLEAAYRVLEDFPQWEVDIFGSTNKGVVFKSRNSQLKYHGHLNNEKVLEHLSKSLISVIPALWNEPFGRTLIESLNSGCAVISSQNGGLAEISRHFKLIKLRNPSKITIYNALKKLIMTPDELHNLQINKIKNSPFNLNNIIKYHDKQRSLFVSK
jgi:glycosyltransferase involved in cell wall biosynthesis